MKQTINEKIEEIIQFAGKREGAISEKIMLDILHDKDESISDDEIEEVRTKLDDLGIYVVGKDEEYTADSVEGDLFIPADVNISQRPMNIYNLMERLENKEIDLSPGFQRHGDLWPLDRQSRLIESLMLKIPIPTFYFNAIDDDKWVVIDGLQRLTAFNKYLVGVEDASGNKRKEKFTGLQYLRDFDGLTFDELPRQYIRRIKEASVTVYTVEKGTPELVVYNIFQRINTGGLELNPQEIRQALCMGNATMLIQKLAESEEFITATQHKISSERMADREYVTRFIAFTELDYREEYHGNIDNYLIKALKLVNTYDEKQLSIISNRFKKVMNYCTRIFGRYAFRKYNSNWHRGPINKAIFELWSVCFSELSEEQLEKLVRQRDEFLVSFGELMQKADFVTALKAGDQYSTARRIELARKLVKEYV
uniref:DUF262 domain-containing protein n=1 Tax=Acetatifactor sp. TaxID=1872090 RepID=UPI004057BCB6